MKFNFFNLPNPVNISLLKSLAGYNPLIINYHVVSDTRLPHVENLYNYRNIEQFNQDLDFFQRHFHLIGLKDLLLWLKEKKPLPESSMLITFDDGFKEIYEIVLPAMEQRNLTATVFLTTNFLDNKELGYANKKSLIISKVENAGNEIAEVALKLLKAHEIEESDLAKAVLSIPYLKRFLLDKLAQQIDLDFNEFLIREKPYLTSIQVKGLINKGWTIGGHSLDHARFSELTIEEQINQAVESTRYVRERFGLDYSVFAFPYSDIGIRRSFFDKTENFFDATFGTQGIFMDSISNNFQRVNIEKFRHHARRSLKWYYLRYLAYKMLKSSIVFHA